MSDVLIESLDIDSDEQNELLFKVEIEGQAAGPARVRMVCEGEEMSYMFAGHPAENGLIRFVVPKKALNEGEYLSKVEVLIENRYFVPVSFNVNVKQAVKVFAEVFKRPALSESKIAVNAVPVKTVQQPVKPIIIESPEKSSFKKSTQLNPGTLAARYEAKKKK